MIIYVVEWRGGRYESYCHISVHCTKDEAEDAMSIKKKRYPCAEYRVTEYEARE